MNSVALSSVKHEATMAFVWPYKWKKTTLVKQIHWSYQSPAKEKVWSFGGSVNENKWTQYTPKTKQYENTAWH